jgi:hypothetical protein
MCRTTFLQSPSVRLFIVSACTARKKFSPPNQLTEADLDDPTLRKHSEARLAGYRLPSVEMYIGTSHNFVRDAIKVLRDNGYLVSHFILSAGYGLLSESDLIVPYNMTFSGASKVWIRERGRQLGLRDQLVARAREHDQVILLLGREYLEAIGLPLPVGSLPPTIVYIAPSLVGRVGRGVTPIPIGQVERREIRAYSASAKEKRFQKDVYGALHSGGDHE